MKNSATVLPALLICAGLLSTAAVADSVTEEVGGPRPGEHAEAAEKLSCRPSR